MRDGEGRHAGRSAYMACTGVAGQGSVLWMFAQGAQLVPKMAAVCVCMPVPPAADRGDPICQLVIQTSTRLAIHCCSVCAFHEKTALYT